MAWKRRVIKPTKNGISGQTKFTTQIFDDSVFVTNGDLLFSWSGQPETSIDVFWWRGPDGWLNQHIFKVTPKPPLDCTFLFYLLRYLKPNFIGIARNKQTTGLGHVTKRDLEIIEAAYPEPAEQRAIAHILGALDDKIEVNRRMSDTLEAMARALFRSWFVDFDPVRAKAERRDTGLSQTFADLFTDTFEDSGLGEIPTGWSAQSLSELAHIYSGGTPSKSNADYWNGTLPWISPKVMTSIHVDKSDQTVTAAAIGNGTRLVPEGSVLTMVRGMGLHQGVRIAQAKREVTFNQDVKALVPKWGDGSFLLFALLDSSYYLHTKVQASGHGTGVLPTDVLDDLSFAVPPVDIRDKLVEPLVNLNAKIRSNSQASATLIALRDTLLPRLLSGEIPIEHAERFQGELT
jgi:type I restriction enzyme S subunit